MVSCSPETVLAVRIDDLANAVIGVPTPRFGFAPYAVSIRKIGIAPGENLGG